MSVLQSVSSVGCEQNHIIPTARAWYQFSTNFTNNCLRLGCIKQKKGRFYILQNFEHSKGYISKCFVIIYRVQKNSPII